MITKILLWVALGALIGAAVGIAQERWSENRRSEQPLLVHASGNASVSLSDIHIYPADSDEAQCKDANGIWQQSRCWAPELLHSEKSAREFLQDYCKQMGLSAAECPKWEKP